MKESFQKAGYEYIKYLGDKEHLLLNSDGHYEIWFSNKNHASYGLTFKNTHLEFARTQKEQSACSVPNCRRCKA